MKLVLAMAAFAVSGCSPVAREERLWDGAQACSVSASLDSYEVERGLWLFCRRAPGNTLVVEFIDRESLTLQRVGRDPIEDRQCQSVVAAAAADSRLAFVCSSTIYGYDTDELTFAVADARGGWMVPPTSVGSGVPLGLFAAGSWFLAIRGSGDTPVTPYLPETRSLRILEIGEGGVRERSVSRASWTRPCTADKVTLADHCVPIAARFDPSRGWRYGIRDVGKTHAYFVDEAGLDWHRLDGAIVYPLNRADFTVFGQMNTDIGRHLPVTAELELASSAVVPDTTLFDRGQWRETIGRPDSRRDQICSDVNAAIKTCIVGERVVHWEARSGGNLLVRDVLTPRPLPARVVRGHTAPATWMELGTDLLVIWRDGTHAVFDKDWNRLPRRVQRASASDATAGGSGR